MAVLKNKFRRLLLTLETLADLGSELTADRPFPETASLLLASLMDSVAAREGALFTFSDKPAMLNGVAAAGFGHFPADPVIPLLPRHVHALNCLRAPIPVAPQTADNFLSSNGNVRPDMFQCVAALRVAGKLVGAVTLGRREDAAPYEEDALQALGMLTGYVALSVQNYTLTQSLEQRVAENLRLLSSVHAFSDKTLEAFATAIDVKHVNVHGHSLRVGRYAAGMAEALGMEASEVSGLRAGGYLHDIGKVAVDKRLFGKPTALDPDEFRQMADHTLVGHQIVSGVEFPWPRLPEVVRWHHERCDGTGYPDRLRDSDAPLTSRIVAVADTLDAMMSERPYRRSLAVGQVLSEIVRITPEKFDPNVVQALLVQVRRDAVGRQGARFLGDQVICNIAPSDIDVLASTLNHKITHGRIYSA